jgi:hypothetical protein
LNISNIGYDSFIIWCFLQTKHFCRTFASLKIIRACAESRTETA